MIAMKKTNRIVLLLLCIQTLLTVVPVQTLAKNLPLQDSDHTLRHMAVEKKALMTANPDKRYLSNGSEETAVLNTFIEQQQYPTKKVVATGYTAGIESTGKTVDHPGYGITYSGVIVKRDLYSTIAADPAVYPIGTVLYIPDYGYGVVADTGSAIKGDKIDLYFETVEDVFQEWGKKETEVHVVKWGNGKLTEAEMLAMNENEAMQVFREQWQDE